MRDIRIGSDLRIPGSAIAMKAVRASGPGGQNVNKVASKVELRVEVRRIEGLSAEARARLASLAGRRLTPDGILVLSSQRTRDQHRNIEDTVDKLSVLVERALEIPVARRPTSVPTRKRNVRLREKKHRGEIKRDRKWVVEED